jgi:aldose 1-epimerase
MNMPFGFGIHPFFNFDDQIELKFKAEREWIGPPEDFPTKTKLVKNNFNINDGNKLWKLEKTVCYENFEGEIQISWVNKNKKIKIKADKIFNHLIVHVPKGGKYFCIEPVSHPTDSFNLVDKKIENIKNQFLKPNESFTGSIKIVVN